MTRHEILERIRALTETINTASRELATLAGPLYYATLSDDKWQPDWTVHPGEILADIMVEREINQMRLAELTGFPQGYISIVLRGDRPISPKFALALETALGGPSAEFWVRAQAAYKIHGVRAASEQEA